MKVGDAVILRRPPKSHLGKKNGLIIEFGHYPGKVIAKGVYQMDGEILVLWEDGKIAPTQAYAIEVKK